MRDIKLFTNCMALYFNGMLLNIKLRVRIVVETKEMVRFFSKQSYLNNGAVFQRSSAIGIPWGIVLLRIADEDFTLLHHPSFFLTNTSLCLRYLSVGWQPVANTLKMSVFCNLLFYNMLDVLR